MLCWRDMSFCSAKCLTVECHRHWDDEKKAAAEKWWGKPGAPVAFMDFSSACPLYRPEGETEMSLDRIPFYEYSGREWPLGEFIELLQNIKSALTPEEAEAARFEFEIDPYDGGSAWIQIRIP